MKRLLPLLFLSSAFAGEVVSSEMVCDETKVIVRMLRENFKEIPVITGKADDIAGSVMTIWTNPITDTWTIVATKDDYSCVIGVGSKFKVIDYAKKKTI